VTKSRIGLLRVRHCCTVVLIPNVACGASRITVFYLHTCGSVPYLWVHYRRSLAALLCAQSTFAVGQAPGTIQLSLTCLQCWLQIAYPAARTVSKHFLGHRCLGRPLPVHASTGSFHNWHCLDGPLLLPVPDPWCLSHADCTPVYTCQPILYEAHLWRLPRQPQLHLVASLGQLPLCFGFLDALELDCLLSPSHPSYLLRLFWHRSLFFWQHGNSAAHPRLLCTQCTVLQPLTLYTGLLSLCTVSLVVGDGLPSPESL